MYPSNGSNNRYFSSTSISSFLDSRNDACITEVNDAPTASPTEAPTKSPTKSPTQSPTDQTENPTSVPTQSPSDKTAEPTEEPTRSPVEATNEPTGSPVTPAPTADDGDACGTAELNQADYRGFISVTETGKTCQRWDTQSPHRHSRTPETYPNSGLEENYCRNPDGRHAKIYQLSSSSNSKTNVRSLLFVFC